MKYLIVSDIHGSSESAQIILNKSIEFSCDKIIILGDILYHGPRNDLPKFYNPKKVIELLNSISSKIIAIKGNCDAEVDEMVLKFPLRKIFIMNLGDKKICLTHGHHINKDNPLNNPLVNDVFYGHTHIYENSIVNHINYINIGSITIPKENTKRCFGIIENDNFTLFDIENNHLLELKL